jgi:hypothetical protein
VVALLVVTLATVVAIRRLSAIEIAGETT